MNELDLGGSTPLPPLAIFTDFDGTLVDLAPTPDAILIPEGLADELSGMARRLDGALAIISGRPITDIDRHLPDCDVAIAGSHGAERRRSDGSEATIGADRTLEAIELARRLRPFVSANPGLLLETKPGAVALHYRLAPELEEACLAAMAEAAESARDFDLLRGKMVIEARPLEVSKAGAIRAFAAEPPFAGRVPIFIGDDTTDEDGFVAAQELGGFGIKVGAGETRAELRVADTGAARAVLHRLAERSSPRKGAAA